MPCMTPYLSPILINNKEGEYPFALAQAISHITGKPVYVCYRGDNFELTASGKKLINVIPELRPEPASGMIGPGKGWAGATRDTLYRVVRRYGEQALLRWMEEYLADEEGNTELRRVTEQTVLKVRHRFNKAPYPSPAYDVIELLRKYETCQILWACQPDTDPEVNHEKTRLIAEILAACGYTIKCLNIPDKPEHSLIFMVEQPAGRGYCQRAYGGLRLRV